MNDDISVFERTTKVDWSYEITNDSTVGVRHLVNWAPKQNAHTVAVRTQVGKDRTSNETCCAGECDKGGTHWDRLSGCVASGLVDRDLS
jgi:hypothetical protein